MTSQQTLDYLANRDIITSVCYGPCGDKGIMFSVNVLTGDGDSFSRPFAASSLEHAIDIAYSECVGRGWVPAYEPR